MEIFKFDSKGNNAPAYSCNRPGDNSGEYVPLETARIMRNLIVDLQASLRGISTVAMVEQCDEDRKLIGI